MALLTYAKAAAAAVPGAGKLPWVAGGGGEMPPLRLSRQGVEVDKAQLAAYARVCGFRLRDELPATYPHILAFPLHMELVTDGSFPFAPMGLVHIANEITVHRPLQVGERFDVHVRLGELEPHPKGRRFDLLTEVSAGGEVVWTEASTTLRRGGGDGSGAGEDGAKSRAREDAPPAATAEWRLPGDLGRRYAAVSGDSNPIHMHPLSAKLFGFPRAIAHGMWTKARSLAALEASLPDAYTVAVEFRKPVLLPGTVGFGSEGDRFAVRSGDRIHLEGRLTR
jgi:acyl dehydratase